MSLTKDELKEWYGNPLTKQVKAEMSKRIQELKEPGLYLTRGDSCEHIAMKTIEKAGIIQGIEEVLYVKASSDMGIL